MLFSKRKVSRNEIEADSLNGTFARRKAQIASKNTNGALSPVETMLSREPSGARVAKQKRRNNTATRCAHVTVKSVK